MEFLLSHQIDKDRWDRIVDQSPNGRIYGYSWYLGGLADNWGALVEGDYEYIMPIPYSRKYGIYYSFNPSYVQQIGIYSDKHEVTEEVYARFLRSIPRKIKLVDLSISLDKEIPLREGRFVKKRTNLVLDIDRPYSDIEKGFSRNIRRIVRDAPDTFRLIEEYDDIQGIIRAYQKEVPYSRIGDVYHGRLCQVAEIARQQGKILPLKLVSTDGEVLSSFTFFLSHERVYSIAGSQTQAGKEAHATYLLMNEFFKRYSGCYKLFDFEGSDIPGIQAFFKKWGGVPEYYSQLRIARFPVNLIRNG